MEFGVSWFAFMYPYYRLGLLPCSMAVYSAEYYEIGRRIAREMMERLERRGKTSRSSHQAVLSNLPDGKISLIMCNLSTALERNS